MYDVLVDTRGTKGLYLNNFEDHILEWLQEALKSQTLVFEGNFNSTNKGTTPYSQVNSE